MRIPMMSAAVEVSKRAMSSVLVSVMLLKSEA